jgi:hypothetical protein
VGRLAGESELDAGDSLRVGSKQGTEAIVLGIAVVGAVGRLVLEVGDDGEAPIALAEAEIIAQRVADRARATEVAEAILDAGNRRAISVGIELDEDDVSDHDGRSYR